MDVVNLNQSNPGAAIITGQNSGEGTRWERLKNTRLTHVREREPMAGKLHCLRRIILPVVVSDESGAVTIVQFQSGIGQYGADPERSQRRPKPAHGHLRSIATATDKPTDHAILHGKSKPPRP